MKIRSNRAKRTTKSAVAYIRVSTEAQELGPEAQRATIEAWAAREGVLVTSWHVDQGVSGAAPLSERPALLEAIAALRGAGAGTLVVAKRDRLGRDTFEVAIIEREIHACKARVQTADGAGNGETGADVFLRRMLDAQAEFERAQIRQRTRDALRVKRARGELTGKAPYGMRVAEDGVRLVSDEGERATVQRALELHAEGLTVRAITARLNDEGRRNRAGKPFAFQSVYTFLRPLVAA